MQAELWQQLRILYEQFANDFPKDCAHWKHASGTNFIKTVIGHGYFDGYVGYSGTGEIAAITWDLQALAWYRAGLPGQAPTTVHELRAQQ